MHLWQSDYDHAILHKIHFRLIILPYGMGVEG